jgi:hypothetical protein
MIYDDSIERDQFCKANGIYYFSEEITLWKDIYKCVSNLDFKKIDNEYRQNQIVIVDNFLDKEVAFRLRHFLLSTNLRQFFQHDYASIDYYRRPNEVWFNLLSNIVDELKENLDILSNKEFIRAWSFIFKNTSEGVKTHADPAAININLWVTPDECLKLDSGVNGLDVFKVEKPVDWVHKQYNASTELCERFVQINNAEKISIDYKFNRAVIFNSAFFHCSQPVRAQDGYENRRINYTFLYN